MSVGWLRSAEVWSEAALGLLYPEVCQMCGKGPAGVVAGYVCAECRRHVRFVEPPFCRRCGLPFGGDLGHEFECANCRGLELQFDWARSAVLAGGLVREAIHRYKYSRHLWLENFLVSLLLPAALASLEGTHWDCIVPVPLHRLKEREREFNQAERIGRRLAQAAGIRLEGRLVRRVKATPTQTRLSRLERQQNMQGAFALSRAVSLKGRRCLLVDDVLTTGSTTSACARVLREAGAEVVAVWTVARGTDGRNR